MPNWRNFAKSGHTAKDWAISNFKWNIFLLLKYWTFYWRCPTSVSSQIQILTFQTFCFATFQSLFSKKIDPVPASFFVFILRLFKQTLKCLQQIGTYVKKSPSSIQCWDSNPGPLENESPTITTIQGPGPIKEISRVKWFYAIFQAFWLVENI